MNRKLYLVLAAAAMTVSSCMKDLDGGNGGKPGNESTIPADFPWKTTQDISAMVAAPVVDGEAPDFAVVRIYASPVLTDENLVAKGVTKVSAPFNTAFTVPAGAKNLYVQTTLPDGRKAVETVAAQPTVSVRGAAFGRTALVRRTAADAVLRESSMPRYPKMELRTEEDFAGDPDAVIRRYVAGVGNYQLGASWAYHAAAEYLIPAGVEITGEIDMNGTFSPYPEPILYVAGKLTVSELNFGKARLAVLPGGEVTVRSLTGNGSGSADKPSIYIFEGGKLTVSGKPNLGNRTLVNCGEMLIGDLDLNNSAVFYNDATALFKAGEVKCSNSVKFFNDGQMQIEKLKLNSNAEFYNCENGRLEVAEECEFERNTTVYQRGLARFDDILARGTLYVNCHTVVVDDFDAQGAEIYFSSGAALDAEEVEFNNTTVSMASGSTFVMKEYNEEEHGGKNTFTAESGADPRAVVVIREKAYTRQGHETWFKGPMEVVYSNSEKKYAIDKSYLKDGAVLVRKQTVVIPESLCNGGKEPVVPDKEPEPAEEYTLVAGAPYTYCFEDNWPYFGDYDMNDVVVVMSVDRYVSQDGSKVSALAINWELKAAGAAYDIACGVQLDKVKRTEVVAAVSSHTGFRSGMFASQELESGQEFAVVPLFNDTKELLEFSNTWPGKPVSATTKHTTRIEFAQPVDAKNVLETSMNIFITPKGRQNEIHMPSYRPTGAGVIASGCTQPDDPYKFFVESGDRVGDNHMMWVLMVPGEFRYPAEGKDIRDVYTYFLPWASSNGTEHEEWYLEDADANLLFEQAE